MKWIHVKGHFVNLEALLNLVYFGDQQFSTLGELTF